MRKTRPGNNRWKSAASVLLYLPILISCNPTPYLAEKSFPDNCWAIGDTVDFGWEYESTDTLMALSVEISFLQEFSYRNLYLRLVSEDQDGNTRAFMINDTLMDGEGNWLGDPGNWVFSQHFQVPVSGPGNYHFRLIQYMREENLCDIQSVRVYPAQHKLPSP
ncbi:MAG: hypothetical protein R3C61_23510 [Bacteroidia bacterium]